MAFKINKKDDARLNDLRDKLAEARSALDETIAKETEVLEDSFSTMNAAIDAYNEVLAEARGVVEDLASEMTGEYDDKSENWQMGERGDATRQWIDELDNIHQQSLDEITHFEFEPPVMDFDDHGEILDNIEREPSY